MTAKNSQWYVGSSKDVAQDGTYHCTVAHRRRRVSAGARRANFYTKGTIVMGKRLRSIAPLAIVVGILAFLVIEFAFNFSFHWVTVKDGVFGKFGLPEKFSLTVSATFIAWGLFFAAGADNAAFWKVLIASTTGCLAAFVVMWLGPATADAPDFWGIALWVGITASAVVVLSTVVERDWFNPALAFICYGSTFFWWTATGLDNFVVGGKGPHTVDALTAAITSKPLAAGTGAFGGLLSTPWQWVSVNVWVSLVLGAVVGAISVRVTALIRGIGRPPEPVNQNDTVGV